MTQTPFVTVIVPCRNEARHIRNVVESLSRSEYPRDRMEALFVDGMSEDGTRQLLEQAARSHGFIRLLENPKRTTPAAMNIGIKQARGEVIVRMDGHSEFAPDYITRSVRVLLETGAGCAGGPVQTLPNGDHGWARAVATVTSHPFGVGDSRFRTGTAERAFVDTVPFGTFPRRALEEVGLFDERLTRNQDNELTARLRKAGYKIALDPGIRVVYRNQSTVVGLMRQAYHTGMWNVYTAALCPYTLRARHFIPGLFVAYLGLLGLAVALAARSGWAAAAAFPLCLYAGLVIAMAATAGPSGGGRLRVAATVVSYHLSYGLGTHLGVANMVTGRWRAQLGRPLRK